MPAPVLDRRLTLEEAQNLPDGAGGFQQSWVTLGALWARLKPRLGGESGADSATLSKAAYVITVRAAPFGAPSRPRPDQRFREGARVFRILAVSDNDDRGRYLNCVAQEEVAS